MRVILLMVISMVLDDYMNHLDLIFMDIGNIIDQVYINLYFYIKYFNIFKYKKLYIMTLINIIGKLSNSRKIKI
jgi:hypothetical protein